MFKPTIGAYLSTKIYLIYRSPNQAGTPVLRQLRMLLPHAWTIQMIAK